MKKSKSLAGLWIILSLAIIGLSVFIYYLVRANENSVPAPTNETIATDSPTSTPQAEAKSFPEEKISSMEIQTDYDSNLETIYIGNQSSAGEEIITFGNIEYAETMDSPVFYSRLSILGIDAPLYGYLNREGNIVLRTYGSRYIKSNNVNKELLTGFFAIDMIRSQTGRTYVQPIDPSRPIIDSADSAAIPEREGVQSDIILEPSKYTEIAPNIYECIDRKGHVVYRTFARVGDRIYMFNCSKAGEIRAGSLPIEIQEDDKNIQPYIKSFDGANGSYSYPVSYGKIILTVTE